MEWEEGGGVEERKLEEERVEEEGVEKRREGRGGGGRSGKEKRRKKWRRKRLTEGVLGDDGVSGDQGLALSKLVDRLHSELVLLSRFEVLGGRLGLVGSNGAWALGPALGSFLPLFQHVLLDLASSVVLGWPPFNRDLFWCRLHRLQRTLGRRWCVCEDKRVYNLYIFLFKEASTS